MSYMKKHYPGLVTRRIAVECQPFMANTSNAKIKVKTSIATDTSTPGQEWKYKEEDLATTITETSLPSLD